MINRTILVGDVLEKLKEIPGETIDNVTTSPPYWGLRDYQEEGQWGLEKDFHEFLEKLRKVMFELWRILKKTGSVWINLGDTYSGGVAHSDWSNTDARFDQKRQREGQFQAFNKFQIQPKSLFGIPERFFAQCIDDGWTARNFIPWIKENAMPQSTQDRFTNKWEPVMFFTKDRDYYFNLDAVREKPKYEPKSAKTPRQNGKIQSTLDGSQEKTEPIEEKYKDEPNSNVTRLHKEREGNPNKQDTTLGVDGKPKANYKGFNERWKQVKEEQYGEDKENRARVVAYMNSTQGSNEKGKNPGDIFTAEKYREHYDLDGYCLGCGKFILKHAVNKRGAGGIGEHQRRTSDYTWCNPKGANPGDIFKINPQPFPQAHFATFPIALPYRILKCSCPNEVCSKCGEPRQPIIKSNNPSKEHADYDNDLDFANTNQKTSNPQSSKSLHRQKDGVYSTAKVIGWTKCECNVEFKPGVVLDPFFGSGTVGIAAEMLSLNWIGIELKQDYVNIARKRLQPWENVRL